MHVKGNLLSVKWSFMQDKLLECFNFNASQLLNASRIEVVFAIIVIVTNLVQLALSVYDNSALNDDHWHLLDNLKLLCSLLATEIQIQ